VQVESGGVILLVELPRSRPPVVVDDVLALLVEEELTEIIVVVESRIAVTVLGDVGPAGATKDVVDDCEELVVIALVWFIGEVDMEVLIVLDLTGTTDVDT